MHDTFCYTFLFASDTSTDYIIEVNDNKAIWFHFTYFYNMNHYNILNAFII